MGLSCCVPGCNHKNGRELCSLYNFPSENDGPDWKEWHDLWCERIGNSQREGAGQSWHPTTWSRVCSCHFKEEERWKPRTRQPGLKFRAPVYFPFSDSPSGSPKKTEPINKTPLLAGLRVDTGMKSSLLAGLNVKIVSTEKDGKSEMSGTKAATHPTNGTQANDVDDKEELRKEQPKKEAVKRESTGTAETAAKKSKLSPEAMREKEGTEEEEEEESDDVELIEDETEDRVLEEKPKIKPGASTAATIIAASEKASSSVKPPQDAKTVAEEKEKKEKKVAVRKGDNRWRDVFKPSNERLLKALTQLVPLTNRTVAPQSKYAELLAVIEDMGRDIRPTYSGSRTATERLKRGIVHARALVRECLAETERSARS